ncbi:unnamed protein product [Echinostoma caproni]|uniref:Uncharacterized protein n=1 Tax=Echinostoma caproni TaxID=27848 RepID=A0A3P8I9D0_9TREM|nr:unnamed protein product [Echinostoma caproni]
MHNRTRNLTQSNIHRVSKKDIHIYLSHKEDSTIQLITQRTENALQGTYCAATLRIHPVTASPLPSFIDGHSVQSTSLIAFAPSVAPATNHTSVVEPTSHCDLRWLNTSLVRA